jgi:hypothetical protein
MDCPVCHTENSSQAATCTRCGRSLKSTRRAEVRRREAEAREAAAFDSPNPAAWRAYRVALWSIVPGLGLLLGLVAVVLGCLAVRGTGDDLSARNRCKAAVLFGFLAALTQWLGITLIIYGWR